MYTRMHTRREAWLLVLLVAVSGTIAVSVSAGVGAVARSAPSSTVFTYFPGPSGTDPTPDLVPSVDCVYHTAGTHQSTYWFGYGFTATPQVIALKDLPANLAVGPANHFVERRGSRTVNAHANRGQGTYFQTGAHRYVFGVTVSTGNSLTWTVQAPDPASHPPLGYWQAAITPVAPPACPRGYTNRSAAPQTTGNAEIRFVPINEQHVNGVLTKSQLKFSVAGAVTSGCSAGGTPLQPRVLWGFSDFAEGGTSNLAPLDPHSVVRVDTFYPGDGATAVTYQRTWNATRTIIDPQRPFTTTPGVSSHGMATTNVLADVQARCAFTIGSTTTIVRSNQTLWVPTDGGPILYGFVTDVPTQTTREVDCYAYMTCELYTGIPSGGIRYR